ncbi:MAG: DUF3098 domain-containing protein [Bacteroidia bacterium]|nr:DUF3098 domain-containing protein [Bacteroidia bacterium]
MAKTKKGKSNQNRRSTKTVKTSGSPKKVVRAASASPEPELSKENIRKQSTAPETTTVLPFGKMNYILLLVCVGLIVLGFFLMSLEKFIDATEFSIALYVAPPIVVAGFLGIIYAIMYKPKENSEAQA